MIIRKVLWLLPLGAALLGLGASPASAAVAPPPVQAFYMYATTLTGLENAAASAACNFATHQPDSQVDIMLLDFGAPRVLSNGDYGALDFSNTTFSNASISSPSRGPPMRTTTVTSRVA